VTQMSTTNKPAADTDKQQKKDAALTPLSDTRFRVI
jgi:hypothetical protein